MSRTAIEKAEDAIILEYYRAAIAPLLPLATRAYGPKTRSTPAHRASSEYTRLLCEFHSLKGSLFRLSKALGVNYSGMRKRVTMGGVYIESNRPGIEPSKEELLGAVSRIRDAKQLGDVVTYHDQIFEEYKKGFSLLKIAKELGLSSAATLYYGVQRTIQRRNNNE